MYTGTHDIVSVSIMEANVIVTTYTEQTSASGVLLVFTYYDNGSTDWTKSTMLALDKDSSLFYTLPSNFYTGSYGLFAYDIEEDGILSIDIGYPAVSLRLLINEGIIIAVHCFYYVHVHYNRFKFSTTRKPKS